MIWKRRNKRLLITGSIILVALLVLILSVFFNQSSKNKEDLSVNNKSDVTVGADDRDTSVASDKNELPTDGNSNEVTGINGNSDNTQKDDGKTAGIDTDATAVEQDNDLSTTKNDNNTSTNKKDNDTSTSKQENDKSIDKKDDIPTIEENNLTKEDVLKILSSTKWHEIGKYTYLAAVFKEDGTFDIWDTVGNPCMKGNYTVDTENMTITFDCSNDIDFDPPFELPNLSTCSYSITREGYLSIQYDKNKMLFQMDKNVKADTDIKGSIWNAVSASDGSRVKGLKLDLGNYFALYNKDIIYFAGELYSIGTVKGYITVNWSGYSNNGKEYLFNYSLLPYVNLKFWDLSDKKLAVADAPNTFEEDMKLQFAYTLKKDTLKIKFDGVTVTFTRGVTSDQEDEIILQKVNKAAK